MVDKVRKERQSRWSASRDRLAGRKLTDEQVTYVRNEVINGRSMRSVARELGVGHTTVIDLIKGNTWKNWPPQ